jgi:hypothetical protein
MWGNARKNPLTQFYLDFIPLVVVGFFRSSRDKCVKYMLLRMRILSKLGIGSL